MKKIKRVIAFILVLAAVAGLNILPASAAGTVSYGAATVKATSLNIRKGAGTNYGVVGTVKNGTIVVVVEKTSDTWYKINYNGTIGYVSASYLTNILTRENFNAKGKLTGNSVRMRSKPDTSASSLGKLKKGTEVSVIGINTGWYKVKYDGLTGYIRSDYVDLYSDKAEEKADTSTKTSSSKSSSKTSTKTSSGKKASSSNKALGEQIADFAKQFEGYKYKYGCESPSTGFDCSGLAYYVYKQFGYKLQRRASLQYAKNGVSVDKADLQPGDLVFFSGNGKSVTHVGIYIGNNQFIHASTSKTGVIISSLKSANYTRSYWGAKRII